MSKENTPSHASQTFLSAGETQAAVHTDFLGGVAGGGKELGGRLAQDVPLNVRAQTFTSNASDALDNRAVIGRNTSGSPSSYSVGAGCADLFCEWIKATAQLDGFVKCVFLFHAPILR